MFRERVSRLPPPLRAEPSRTRVAGWRRTITGSLGQACHDNSDRPCQQLTGNRQQPAKISAN